MTATTSTNATAFFTFLLLTQPHKAENLRPSLCKIHICGGSSNGA
jgi:hypothetical protein